MPLTFLTTLWKADRGGRGYFALRQCIAHPYFRLIFTHKTIPDVAAS